jgi:hypothetical protein
MLNDPVKVYDANNGAEAEMIREQLAEADVEAVVDTTPSPLDGLTAMGQGTPIFVDRSVAEKARQIIDNSLHHEHKPGDDEEGE